MKELSNTDKKDVNTHISIWYYSVLMMQECPFINIFYISIQLTK